MAATQISLTRARGMGSLPNLVEQAVGGRALERLSGRLDRPVAVLAGPDRWWISKRKSDDVIGGIFEYVPREQSIND